MTLPGLGPVLADLDWRLEQEYARADATKILESFQQNAEAELQ